jgi:hypothetical protein
VNISKMLRILIFWPRGWISQNVPNYPLNSWFWFRGPKRCNFWAFSDICHFIQSWKLPQFWLACEIWTLDTWRLKNEGGNTIRIKISIQNLCILNIKKILKLGGMVPAENLKTLFVIFGCIVLKCNGLSKLVSVFLGPLVMVIMR